MPKDVENKKRTVTDVEDVKKKKDGFGPNCNR